MGNSESRQKMVDIVNQDDGTGGTSDANNREYGGRVTKTGVVVPSTPGAVANPKSGLDATVDITSWPGQSTFHSHQSGTNETSSYKQAPSNKVNGDINTFGEGTHYVFARGEKTVYIFNHCCPTKIGFKIAVTLY